MRYDKGGKTKENGEGGKKENSNIAEHDISRHRTKLSAQKMCVCCKLKAR